METQTKYKVLPVVKKLVTEVVRENPKQIYRTIIYCLTATIFPFFAIMLPKIAIGIIENPVTSTESDLIKAMVIFFVGYFVVGFLMNKMQFAIEMDNMRARLRYICDMGIKTMTMDYNYVEDAKFWQDNEKATQACNNNTYGMEGMLNKLFKVPGQAISIVVMMVMAAALNPIILLALLLHVGVTMWISKADHNYRYARKDQEAKLTRKIGYYEKTSQDFAFGKDVRIYNLRNRILGNYQTEINAFAKLERQFENHKYFISLAGTFTLLATNVIMYGLLIFKCIHGMPVSSFSMYITLILQLMGALTEFGKDIAFLQNEGQYVGDAFKLMDTKLTTDDKEKIEVKKGETLEIVFDHVDFKYPNTDTYIYKDLNFKINKGERLAIVGVNGAGKSTLVKLMTGLFMPTAGSIYINGIDTKDFNKKDLYDLYSAVFQDVNILAFPIRENVTGASENVDDARVKEALTDVGLWDKVSGFEKGLDQMMLKVIDEEGTDFSGGERQKLSIARGLYKDAPMIIMDEPTAALDALAEAAIYESFSAMVKGKTAVYISHRLASTKFCDKIALFDKTGLIEYGTHDELMERKGKYYDMFVIQGKYYQNQEDNEEEIA